MSRWPQRLGIALIASMLGVAGAAAQNTDAAVQALQNRMLSDPQVAGRIHSLSDDPDVRDVLDDPEIADALQRGDYGALLNHPKIQRLAEDPDVQSITRDIAK